MDPIRKSPYVSTKPLGNVPSDNPQPAKATEIFNTSNKFSPKEEWPKNIPTPKERNNQNLDNPLEILAAVREMKEGLIEPQKLMPILINSEKHWKVRFVMKDVETQLQGMRDSGQLPGELLKIFDRYLTIKPRIGEIRLQQNVLWADDMQIDDVAILWPFFVCRDETYLMNILSVLSGKIPVPHPHSARGHKMNIALTYQLAQIYEVGGVLLENGKGQEAYDPFPVQYLQYFLSEQFRMSLSQNNSTDAKVTSVATLK